jgi:hypothetical protein
VAALQSFDFDSISTGIKRLPQSLHFKAGAKKREQTSYHDHSAFSRQQKIGATVKLGNMPEDHDAEKRAAEDKTQLTQKQKYVTEDRTRTLKRDWNKEHAAPKRDLHDAENIDRDNIREAVAGKLVARIDRELPELRKYLASKRDRAQYLDSKQEQIRARFPLFVACFHWSMISVNRWMSRLESGRRYGTIV